MIENHHSSSFNTNDPNEITKSFVEEPEDIAKRSNLSDKAAALHNLFFALGSMSGPPLGGGLYDSVGWQWTCLIMAIVSIAASLIYALVLCWLRGQATPTKHSDSIH